MTKVIGEEQMSEPNVKKFFLISWDGEKSAMRDGTEILFFTEFLF